MRLVHLQLAGRSVSSGVVVNADAVAYLRDDNVTTGYTEITMLGGNLVIIVGHSLAETESLLMGGSQ